MGLVGMMFRLFWLWFISNMAALGIALAVVGARLLTRAEILDAVTATALAAGASAIAVLAFKDLSRRPGWF